MRSVSLPTAEHSGTGGSRLNTLLNNQKISISWCMVSFVVTFVLSMKIDCCSFVWLDKNWSFFIVVVMLAATVTVAPAFPFDCL